MRFLFTIMLVPLLAGCTPMQRVSTETSLAKMLVSDQQMEQIGEQVHAELQSQGVRYVKNTAVTGYVEGIAGRLFGLARGDRDGVNYHVHVIDDPKMVNAFATPGGHIYVYSGLLLAADNEAEVAGVLAHETGHVAGRHVERAMVNSYGVQTLASLALGQNPSMAKELAATVLGTGLLRAHSRSEETEADEYGARYISRLSYDPQAMITFFQKLQAKESGASGGMAWLRTHPVTGDRIAHLREYIGSQRLGGSVLGRERHLAVEQKLAQSFEAPDAEDVLVAQR
jgi:predicted Zn-dependent protease